MHHNGNQANINWNNVMILRWIVPNNHHEKAFSILPCHEETYRSFIIPDKTLLKIVFSSRFISFTDSNWDLLHVRSLLNDEAPNLYLFSFDCIPYHCLSAKIFWGKSEAKDQEWRWVGEDKCLLWVTVSRQQKLYHPTIGPCLSKAQEVFESWIESLWQRKHNLAGWEGP